MSNTSGSPQQCDVRKDECGVGRECLQGTCVQSSHRIPVGHPCDRNEQCETNACVSLDAAVAQRAHLTVVPRVCDAKAPHAFRTSDF